ncbi:MAG: PUA domain-containing protein [Candidatus Heimdallarchaeota archaeon]
MKAYSNTNLSKSIKILYYLLFFLGTYRGIIKFEVDGNEMNPSAIQLERIKVVLTIQFPGLNSSSLLQNIEISISKKTRRIKEIYEVKDDSRKLLFVLRPNDGRFLPSIYGAQRILDTGYQGHRVVMNQEASIFVKKGKSAFCKHVIKVDDDIQPNAEVFLLDPELNLLAVGSAVQPGYAMLELQAGVAVKPRKYTN